MNVSCLVLILHSGYEPATGPIRGWMGVGGGKINPEKNGEMNRAYASKILVLDGYSPAAILLFPPPTPPLGFWHSAAVFIGDFGTNR
jgi:hypothetical protein